MECELMFMSSRVHLESPGLPVFDKIDKENQSMAAALSVKAASDLLVRFFLAMLDAWGRSEVKVLSRSADANRELWWSVYQWKAARPWEPWKEQTGPWEMWRTMEHESGTRVGGWLENDIAVGSFAGTTYEPPGGPLLKCFGTTVTEADMSVLAKSCGLGYPEQDCCVESLKVTGWSLSGWTKRKTPKSTWAATSTGSARARLSQVEERAR